MHKNSVSVSIIMAAIFALPACGKETTRTATATANGEDGVTVVFDNGKTAANMSEYETIVAENPPLVTEQSSFELTLSTTGDGPTVSIGKFKIKIYVSTEYLAGCINQKAPHLVISVTNDAAPLSLIELHLAGWFNNKKPCLGLLNKSVIAYGFCLKGCFSDSKSGIKTSVKNGLIAAGISGSVATILSALAAPVVVPALGL